MKERPKCSNPQCSNPALMLIDDNVYCGECITKLNNIRKEKNRQQMLEELNDNNNMSEMPK